MEDMGSECTHHQRKQVKLAKEDFFSRSESNRDVTLCTGIDDKASGLKSPRGPDED